MTFTQIKDQHEQVFTLICRITDAECSKRVKSLAAQLKRFKFQKFILAMGVWSSIGAPVIIVYESDAFWIVNLLPALSSLAFEPIEYILTDLLDWWVEETGGQDVVLGK